MKSYLEILKHVYENGVPKQPVRVRSDGTSEVVENGTIGVSNLFFSHNMSEGFPLLTTKKMPLKVIAVELEGFIKGITDKRWFQERGCHIWDDWCNPQKLEKRKSIEYSKTGKEPSREQVKEWQKDERDLGPIYGYQLRSFNKTYQPIPHAKLEKVHNPVSVIGIGSLGDRRYNRTVPNWQKLRKSWQEMLRRCYIKEDRQYINYGQRGVFVDDDWLILSNYLRDIQKISGWNKKLENWDGYSLDKDVLGGRCYSKDTCLWISKYEQVRNSSQIHSYIASNENEKIFFNSMIDVEAAGFCRSSVNRCCSGKYSFYNGFKWGRIRNTKNDYNPGFDQLKSICDKLRNNPLDRRMVVSYWNPEQFSQFSLPPCHFTWGVVVYGDTLNLYWVQRSVDTVLGLPFNIASYALLLLLLAEHAGLKPGNLSGSLVDVHIYNNQMDGVREQLSREPRALPSLHVDCPDIFEWDHTRLRLENYDPYPTIKFEVTV